MAEIKEHQTIQETGSTRFQWGFNGVLNDVIDEYDSDFVEECSNDEMADDATSSSSSSSSSSSTSFELSELMAELPIKRGLSKFYHGKSESFGSLANFNNIQDLAKKRNCRSRRSKCESQSQKLSPKGIIVKNKKSCSSSLATRSCFVSSLGEMSSILDTIVVKKSF